MFLESSYEVKLEILAESLTERDSVLTNLLAACEAGDSFLAGKIIIDALKDYAHDCATGGVLT